MPIPEQRQLQAIKEKLEERSSNMECTHDNRSEKWQESEKGEYYNEQREAVDEVVDLVFDAIEKLGEYFGEI